jgi:outer membrane protein OmpA-like peptidoglycan-associated protein
MRKKLFTLFALSVLVAGSVCAQPDPKGYKRQAEQFFNSGNYQQALEQYLLYEAYSSGDVEAQFRAGICLYETNKLADAMQRFNELAQGKKFSNPELYLYLGRCAHQSLQFLDAIHFYKDYLRKIDANHPGRAQVKDQIRRCAYGLRIQQAKSNIIVENLGEAVNTPMQDFRPIPSPSQADKFYFSSIRVGNAGGMRDESGRESQSGSYTSDMFSVAYQTNGWSTPTALSYLLNSSKNEVLQDFSQDGTVLYYFQGLNLFSGDMLVDTFRLRPEERSLFSPVFMGPVRSWEGDKDLHFFQDTILLFSSQRPGGYGGYDLYLSIYSRGAWSDPQNLGPRINTAYDERSPFLSVDGRTLYFSANHPMRSLGGFDVLRVFYDDASESWLEPRNLGVPVNSAGDELDFRLTGNGMRAYFSSTRKSGFGQSDIYMALFREAQREQMRTMTPLVFSQVPDFKLQFARRMGQNEDPAAYFPEDQIEKYFLEPLYFDADGEILTGRNMKTLRTIADLMVRFPQLRILLTSHSDGTDPDNVDLFFAAKRAEVAADFLARSGVNLDHILIKSLGKSYPVAQSTPSGQQANRRIDISFLDKAGLPLRIRIKEPSVPEGMGSNSWDFYQKTIQGLSYKLEIAATSQMYAGDLLFRYPHAMIEKESATGVYQYTVGLYKTFTSARQLQQDLVRNGALNTRIIPYIDGVRVSPEQASALAADFPDLNNFLQQ